MLATTLSNSIYLVLGFVLLTSVAGCSGCQQQRPSEQTSTEDAAETETAEAETQPTQPAEEQAPQKPAETNTGESARSEAEMKVQPTRASTQEDASAEAAPGKPKTHSSSSNTSTSAMNASQALTQAKELYTSAKSDNLPPEEAFQNASQAWELLNQHPQNAKCQAMATEIARSLGSMAAKANQKYSTELSGDPVLIEK